MNSSRRGVVLGQPVGEHPPKRADWRPASRTAWIGRAPGYRRRSSPHGTSAAAPSRVPRTARSRPDTCPPATASPPTCDTGCDTPRDDPGDAARSSARAAADRAGHHAVVELCRRPPLAGAG